MYSVISRNRFSIYILSGVSLFFKKQSNASYFMHFVAQEGMNVNISEI